jgi:hypothetical protein
MWRIFLLLLIIAILYLVLQYSENNIEAFAKNAKSPNKAKRNAQNLSKTAAPRINACPRGSVTFVTKSGDQECCEGTVVGHTCNGNSICVLTKPKNGGLPSCGNHIKKLYNERGNRFCPKSMPNYFDNNIDSRGCTKGARNRDWSAPLNRNESDKDKCIIYKTEKEDLKYSNSCYLVKKLDAIKCVIPGSKKEFVHSKYPGCSFKDTNNIPRTCINKDDFIELIWKDYKNTPQKNVMTYNKYYADINKRLKNDLAMCDVAKRFYFEKSIATTSKTTNKMPVKKLTTWSDITKLFPGNRAAACYTSKIYSKNCLKILEFTRQNPNDSNTKIITNYCNAAPYKNPICIAVLDKLRLIS